MACSSYLFHITRVTRNPGKIIIPKLPGVYSNNNNNNSEVSSSNNNISSSSSPYQKGEYRANKYINTHITQFLPTDAAQTLHRQQQLHQFRNSTETAAEKVWRDSKSHLRRQEKLIKEIGVEGAAREVLQPTHVSFHQELRQRPLDRGILEEIYKGLHGKRIERQLKKGVAWEHWITKGDGTAPVFTASRKAQQTFAFGGKIQLIAKATHAKQFPIVFPGGRKSQNNDNNNNNNNNNNNKKKVEDIKQLVPEVAFIGKTCSGKSSLINSIANAMIAPYGHLQGTTNSVNFYNIANKIVLVDCPGYGYYNPMETPAVDAENAITTMRTYLTTCRDQMNFNKEIPKNTKEEEEGGITIKRPISFQQRPIKRVFVCVSARGLQHNDISYLDYLESLGIPFSVILTKTDSAPIRFLARLTDHTRCRLVHYKHCKELMLASSLRLAGIDKLQNLIGSMALGEDKLHGATSDFSAIV